MDDDSWMGGTKTPSSLRFRHLSKAESLSDEVNENIKLRAELAAKEGLLKEAVDAILKAVINLPDHTAQWPCHCRSCAVGALLQAFLARPEVKALGGGE